jgi:hypothetical protein
MYTYCGYSQKNKYCCCPQSTTSPWHIIFVFVFAISTYATTTPKQYIPTMRLYEGKKKKFMNMEKNRNAKISSKKTKHSVPPPKKKAYETTTHCIPVFLLARNRHIQ